MKRPRALIACTLAFTALAWSACSDDDATGPTVAVIQVTPATATLLVGESLQLNATAQDGMGDPVSVTISWSSSNTAVATVSTSGLVTGVAPGTATITASAGDENGTASVTVQVPVASVEVTPATDTVRAGETAQLTATPRDAADNPLTGRTITWMSDAETIATVDDAGLVTGVDNGAATITATSEGESGSAEVVVFVGVTGTWSGTIDAPAGMCPLDPTITEDTSGDVTGTANLDAPCTVATLDVTGTNNTDGVADSLSLTFTTGSSTFMFEGSFDGMESITGLINGEGCTDCPTSFSRNSIATMPGAGVRRSAPAPAEKRGELFKRD